MKKARAALTSGVQGGAPTTDLRYAGELLVPS
jgi:hypothetical protein